MGFVSCPALIGARGHGAQWGGEEDSDASCPDSGVKEHSGGRECAELADLGTRS